MSRTRTVGRTWSFFGDAVAAQPVIDHLRDSFVGSIITGPRGGRYRVTEARGWLVDGLTAMSHDDPLAPITPMIAVKGTARYVRPKH